MDDFSTDNSITDNFNTPRTNTLRSNQHSFTDMDHFHNNSFDFDIDDFDINDFNFDFNSFDLNNFNTLTTNAITSSQTNQTTKANIIMAPSTQSNTKTTSKTITPQTQKPEQSSKRTPNHGPILDFAKLGWQDFGMGSGLPLGVRSLDKMILEFNKPRIIQPLSTKTSNTLSASKKPAPKTIETTKTKPTTELQQNRQNNNTNENSASTTIKLRETHHRHSSILALLHNRWHLEQIANHDFPRLPTALELERQLLYYCAEQPWLVRCDPSFREMAMDVREEIRREDGPFRTAFGERGNLAEEDGNEGVRRREEVFEIWEDEEQGEVERQGENEDDSERYLGFGF